MCISFLAVIVLGSLLAHHSGVYTLYIWLYMAICSHIYMSLTIYMHCISICGKLSVLFHCFLLPYWAARARFGLCVPRFKCVYIYIYIGSALRASLYIVIHTCIWAIYAPSKPCIHIYVCHIYVCCLNLHVNMHYILCIYHFGMLQACRLSPGHAWLEIYRMSQMVGTVGWLARRI